MSCLVKGYILFWGLWFSQVVCYLVLDTMGDSEDPPLDRTPRGESAIPTSGIVSGKFSGSTRGEAGFSKGPSQTSCFEDDIRRLV